jgi:cysteine desulfurase/selenocysteine lyase
VYLDNAATTQKPASVLEALQRYYQHDNANVHRGVHTLSERATVAYESARDRVRGFLNAASSKEIVFVRGTTEGINLVAQSWGRKHVRADDEILVSEMEHHSNIVPWQMLCGQVGARLRVAPINDAGELVIEEFERRLTARTRLVAVSHCSNALGTINPVRSLTAMAHAAGARVLIDGAQAAPHMRVDVRDIDCDFYAFSGHKTYGPTGIGVLFGKADVLADMPPYQGGGEMIRYVTFEGSEYAEPPYRFEAGTPNIAGAIGLGAAISYVTALGLEAIAAHEAGLLRYANQRIMEIPGIRLFGTAPDKACILSFEIEGIHPHDLGTIFDHEGVAIRAGHHCAMPVMQRYGVPATARASFALYNTRDEVDALVSVAHKARELFC